jgi:hypothetical protein
MLSPSAAPKPEQNVPDLSGLWARVAVKGESRSADLGRSGWPADRTVWTPGPDIEIVSGNYDNRSSSLGPRDRQGEHRIGNRSCMCTKRTICAGRSGLPRSSNLRENVRFIQAKDRVTIVYQRDHLVRRVYMNRSIRQT